jgi:hypothetical protein
MKNFYDQNWLNNDIELPRGRKELNAIYRSIYATHPIVNSIINSHSEIPLNYLSITLEQNIKADNFFKDQIDKIGLLGKLQHIIQEFWLVGETFIYCHLDEKIGTWSDLTIQNPDYVIVKRTIDNGDKYYLRPDENLRRIVLSDKEEDKKIASALNSKIVEHIKNGENISLDSFYFSHIVRKISPYEVRGTSLLSPILSIIKNADKENITSNTIRTCLMDPFLDENVNHEKIRSRYGMLFTTLEQWLNKKIFSPIAKINGLYEYKDGERILCIPNVKFDLDGLIKSIKE